MGIIRDALIGIALYEVAKYVLGTKTNEVLVAGEGSGHAVGLSNHPAGNVSNPGVHSPVETTLNNQDLDAGLAAGANPDTLLTGDGSLDLPDDTWKNSLANDELRAPDS